MFKQRQQIENAHSPLVFCLPIVSQKQILLFVSPAAFCFQTAKSLCALTEMIMKEGVQGDPSQFNFSFSSPSSSPVEPQLRNGGFHWQLVAPLKRWREAARRRGWRAWLALGECSLERTTAEASATLTWSGAWHPQECRFLDLSWRCWASWVPLWPPCCPIGRSVLMWAPTSSLRSPKCRACGWTARGTAPGCSAAHWSTRCCRSLRICRLLAPPWCCAACSPPWASAWHPWV